MSIHKVLKKVLLISIALFSCVFIQTSSAQPYIFDSSRTKISFNISLLGSLERQGTFSQFSGRVNYFPKKINSSKLTLKIATNSLRLDLPESLQMIAEGDIFKTKQYPYMYFHSTDVAMKKHTQNGAKGTITGKLNFMGKKRLEVFDVRLRELPQEKGSPAKIFFYGSSTIDRNRYGVRLPVLAQVGEQIPIKITGLLVQTKGLQ